MTSEKVKNLINELKTLASFTQQTVEKRLETYGTKEDCEDDDFVKELSVYMISDLIDKINSLYNEMKLEGVENE